MCSRQALQSGSSSDTRAEQLPSPARGTERRSPCNKLDCLAVFRLSSVRHTANNAYIPLIAQCSLNNGASDKSFFTFSVSLSFFSSSMPTWDCRPCGKIKPHVRLRDYSPNHPIGCGRSSDSTCNCSEMCRTASYYDLLIAVF